MNDDCREVRLINFSGTEAANKLLVQFELQPDIGSFLANHVQDVLQMQHPDLKMESIELLSIDECTVGGRQLQDSTIAEVGSLKIPVVIEAIVLVKNDRYCLKLDVTLRSTSTGNGRELESDVVVREQMKI